MKPKINLHDNETLLFELQPKPALVGYYFITRAWHLIAILIVISVFTVNKHVPINNPQPGAGTDALLNTILLHPAFVTVIVVLLAGLSFLWAISVVHKHWYFFTDQRCILYSGFWGINKKIIPYNRVIDVDMNRNPLRALFGISAVYLDQAGMSMRSGKNANITLIDGLSHDDAEKITDAISAKMSGATG